MFGSLCPCASPCVVLYNPSHRPFNFSRCFACPLFLSCLHPCSAGEPYLLLIRITIPRKSIMLRDDGFFQSFHVRELLDTQHTGTYGTVCIQESALRCIDRGYPFYVCFVLFAFLRYDSGIYRTIYRLALAKITFIFFTSPSMGTWSTARGILASIIRNTQYLNVIV